MPVWDMLVLGFIVFLFAAFIVVVAWVSRSERPAAARQAKPAEQHPPLTARHA